MNAASSTDPLAAAFAAAGLDDIDRARLTRLLADIDRASWYATVDDSPYSLADWLDALLTFDRWLAARAIEARPVATMLGYLECCTLTLAETLPVPALASLLTENLERYGFDAVANAGREPA